MRYRRLVEQLRTQNWMAVVIDLVIVIVGVFMGIQVANWNEDRATARRAEGFTERLKSDLREEAWGYEMQVGYYGDVVANGRRALDALAGRAALPDEALLVAAYRATQYNGNIRRRATYDELTSRGEIGLVADGELRDLAQRVYTSPMFDYIVEEGRTSPYREWFRQSLPHELQLALRDGCGDRHVAVGDYAGINGSLDYPCTLELSDESVTAAVALLRDSLEAQRLLRLRVADVDTGVENLTVYFADMRRGLQKLAGVAQ